MAEFTQQSHLGGHSCWALKTTRLLDQLPRQLMCVKCCEHEFLSLSQFQWPFSRWTWVSCSQNVSILDFIKGAKESEGGGDNWSYTMCKAPVKLTPSRNQHPTFYRLDAISVTQPTASTNWRERFKHEFRARKICWHPITLILIP